MKKIKFLCLAALTSWQIKAQNPTLILGSNYYIPSSSTATLLPQQPTYPGGYVGMTANGIDEAPTNLYSDATKKPLFFISQDNNFNLPVTSNSYNLRQNIYNNNGFMIAQLQYKTLYPNTSSSIPVTGEALGWGETCIVPDPSSCNRFYIFTSGEQRTTYNSQNPANKVMWEPYYGLLDLSLQTNISTNPLSEKGRMITPGVSNLSGNGEATLVGLYDSNITPSDLDPSSNVVAPYHGDIRYSATQPLSSLNGDRLVFMNNSAEIIIYRLSSSGGISFYKYYDLNTITMNNCDVWSSRNAEKHGGEMELYIDYANSKIKIGFVSIHAHTSGGANYTSIDDAIVLLDFDLLGNYINGSYKFIDFRNCNNSSNNPTIEKIIGLEFSPNGSWIYYTKKSTPLFPATFGAVNTINVSTRININPVGVNMNDFSKSQIELGKDGSLYMATNNRLVKLSNPNNPNASNFNNSALSLPNNPVYKFNTKYLSGLTPVVDPSTFIEAYLLPDQIDGDAYNRYPATVNAIDNQTICLGSCINLSIDADIISGGSVPAGVYTWSTTVNGNNVSVGTGTTVNVCPNATTTYTLNYKNKQGCEAQDKLTITVVTPPNPNFSYAQITSNATYNTITATANDISGSNVAGFQEKWKIETLDATGAVIANTELGTNPNPSCWLTQLGTTDFTSFNGSNNVSCANLLPGNFAKNTQYRITRSVKNAYCNTWVNYTLPIYSGQRLMNSSQVKNPEELKITGLHIFPNPSNGQLNISFENAQDAKYNIEVFDVYGKLIYKNEVANTTGSIFKTQIDLSNLELSNGLYLINVNSENQKSSQRIVIEK